MRKKNIILFVLAFTGLVFAQPPERRSPTPANRREIIEEVEEKIEPGEVLEFLSEIDRKIQEGIKKRKPVSAIALSTYVTSAQIYLDYRWFIADTGLSKKWLKKIHELLAYMRKTKRYMQIAKFAGRTKRPKYKKALEYFDVAHERLVKLLKKPEKVSKRIHQTAMVKKDMWQRKMRKKYNIKEKNWYE